MLACLYRMPSVSLKPAGAHTVGCVKKVKQHLLVKLTRTRVPYSAATARVNPARLTATERTMLFLNHSQ